MIRLECIDTRLILGCSTNYADANFRDKLAYRKFRFGYDYLSRGLFSSTPRLARNDYMRSVLFPCVGQLDWSPILPFIYTISAYRDLRSIAPTDECEKYLNVA